MDSGILIDCQAIYRLSDFVCQRIDVGDQEQLLRQKSLSWTDWCPCFSQSGVCNQEPAASMSPLFQCLICGQSIERSKRSYWKRKGHLLCSTCRDRIDSGEDHPVDEPSSYRSHRQWSERVLPSELNKKSADRVICMTVLKTLLPRLQAWFH